MNRFSALLMIVASFLLFLATAFQECIVVNLPTKHAKPPAVYDPKRPLGYRWHSPDARDS